MEVNLTQQFGPSFAYGKATIELDPELPAQREDAYEWANRLTATRGRQTIKGLHTLSVRTTTDARRRFPLVEFVRASSLHVGAAAAAAALRRELVDGGRLPSGAFDEGYAVARVTPGTNLLAMYVLLGERFAGWTGAVTALAVGAFVPAVIVVLLGAAYVTYSDHLVVREVMQGARAGALAVLAWAIVRLVRPQILQHRRRGVAIAFTTLLIALALPIPQFMILLIAGGVGAALLKVDA